ncbi:DUF4349 domain-containing protein [Bacillus salitolerans]|uniref:DUF4349 domain-containing protein n=1 Tax=Bacillus salitolerans TaxID=1437434 RepID=A0ABW4LK98_9BACI
MKMKSMIISMVFIMMIFTVSACSGGSQLSTEESTSSDSQAAQDSTEESTSSDSQVAQNSASMESKSTENSMKMKQEGADSGTELLTSEIKNVTDQMIIYHANIRMEVKDFMEARENIINYITKNNGYIANSTTEQMHDGNLGGSLTIRIPQEHFQTVINQAESLSVRIHHQTIEGQDVTEEYVDLNSRLKSKEVVEQRLLGFMQKADKTEDLLKISSDLGRVQEEIEQIKGRVHYLQNQVSFSTIHLSIFENKVIVPSIDEKDTNTWDKTKKQFVNSIQFLLSLASGIFIFIIGNSPVLLFFALVAIMVILIIRHQKKKLHKKGSEENSNME